jgi:hypothetical protein
MTDDISKQLAEIASLLRSKQRKRKADPVKQSLLNKGFDIDKEKRKQKRTTSAYRYPTRLQQINDARAEAARRKRLASPDLAAINEETIKLAEQKVAEQKKERLRLSELNRYRSRPMNSYRPFKTNPYAFGDNEKYIEVVPTKHREPPKFKNKIEEHIYILKKKK